MGRDEVDGVGELRVVPPDIPDFTRGDGNANRLLDPLDELDQPMNVVLRQCPFQRFGPLVLGLRFSIANPLAFLAQNGRGVLGAGFGRRLQVFDRNLLAAVNGFIADHDPDHVAVVPGKADDGFDLAVVAVGVLIDPGADRDLQAELRSDWRHEFVAFGRRIQTHRAGQRRELLQIGANFFGIDGDISDRVPRFERRIGDARQQTTDIGRRLLFLENTPKRSVSGGHKQQNGDDGAHRD